MGVDNFRLCAMFSDSIIPADCVQYLILEVYGSNNNKDPIERAVLHLNIKTQIV